MLKGSELGQLCGKTAANSEEPIGPQAIVQEIFTFACAGKALKACLAIIVSAENSAWHDLNCWWVHCSKLHMERAEYFGRVCRTHGRLEQILMDGSLTSVLGCLIERNTLCARKIKCARWTLSRDVPALEGALDYFFFGMGMIFD